jgi:nicotinamide mononucleotide adenylyltransferase
MSAPVATSETQLRQYEDKISLDAYSLPIHRLKKVMDDPSRTPVVLVCCGSFSPITCLHMRIFEMASDFVTFNTTFEVVGGYFSPVSDAYGKLGLESAEHRYVFTAVLSRTLALAFRISRSTKNPSPARV